MNWFDWQAKLKKRSNFMGGILPITWAQVPAEVVAGASLAAIAIPDVMGYAQLPACPLSLVCILS